MKKIFSTLFVVFALTLLVACGNGKKEFAHDGEFSAYEVSVHSNGPMVTSVTVTVEKGKITKYYIDARQGSTVKEGEDITAVAWNAKTKKELGNEYGMKGVGPKYELKDGAWIEVEGAKSEKEWFEQAELLEAKWLKDGVDSLTLTDGRIDNVAGVTLKDGGYIKLAKEAVANAKAGKVVVFKTSLTYGAADLVSVTLELENGKAKSLVVDTLQSKVDAVEGLVWNAKSKQELGFEYKMHWPAFATAKPEEADQTLENYKAWLKENNKLEWFEQVALITDHALKNNGSTKIDSITSVTVHTEHYTELIDAAYKAAKLK